MEACSLVLAAAALVPVLHILPLANNVIAADRFLYLPLAGFAVAAASAIARSDAPTKRAALVLAVVGVSTFPFAAHARNEDWSDELGFWSKVVKETRWDNTGPRRETSRILFRKARWTPLLRALETVTFVSGTAAAPRVMRLDLKGLEGRAAGLDALGTYDWAIQFLDDLGRRDPSAPVAFEAAALLQAGDFAGARALTLTLGAATECQGCRRLLVLARYVDARGLEAIWRENPAPAGLAERARALRRVGGELAESAWYDVAVAESAPLADRLEAAAYLVERGSRVRALRAVSAVRRSLPDASQRQELLSAMADRGRDDAHIAEIERIVTARAGEASR
jgi:hypothetical protein